jgi:hypothetical protein
MSANYSKNGNILSTPDEIDWIWRLEVDDYIGMNVCT